MVQPLPKTREILELGVFGKDTEQMNEEAKVKFKFTPNKRNLVVALDDSKTKLFFFRYTASII